jgi:hypothetical protein
MDGQNNSHCSPWQTIPNRSNGVTSPRTPNHTGLALTEYTANPSPHPESPKHSVIPKAFLLPNGQPDVLKLLFFVYKDVSLTVYLVPPPYPHLTGLRGCHRNSPHTRDKPEQSIGMQYSPQARGPSARVQLQTARRIQQNGTSLS